MVAGVDSCYGVIAEDGFKPNLSLLDWDAKGCSQKHDYEEDDGMSPPRLMGSLRFMMALFLELASFLLI